MQVCLSNGMERTVCFVLQYITKLIFDIYKDSDANGSFRERKRCGASAINIFRPV